MKKIIAIAIIGMFLLTGITVISATGEVTSLLREIVVPDDYPTIQEAIDAAGMYGKVRVKPGMYYENIIIDETGLTLKGDYHTTTIIDGNGSGNVITIEINTHGVEISGFTIQHGAVGIMFQFSTYNHYIVGNSITNNDIGINAIETLASSFYHNNFISNAQHVDLIPEYFVYDDGYPSGGNYWDDCTGADEYSGPNQDIPGSDGIGDTPYNVLGSEYGQDKYPFMEQDGWVENFPPEKPVKVSGPTSGKAGTEYTYKFKSNDPDGDQVKYRIDWGDNTPIETTNLEDSGVPVEVKHTWEEKGDYSLTVTAIDENNLESEPLMIPLSMPKSRPVPSNILAKFFELFPNVFPLLRLLLKL